MVRYDDKRPYIYSDTYKYVNLMKIMHLMMGFGKLKIIDNKNKQM